MQVAETRAAVKFGQVKKKQALGINFAPHQHGEGRGHVAKNAEIQQSNKKIQLQGKTRAPKKTCLCKDITGQSQQKPKPLRLQ